MVAAGMGDDAGRFFGFAQLADGIIGPAKFEGPHALKVFALEKKCRCP
jgi:hypothetical protein